MVLKSQPRPLMALLFVNTYYKELYTTQNYLWDNVTIFFIGFMLPRSSSSPPFLDLTIPLGSWFILKHTVHNKSQILLEICSLCVAFSRICPFLLPFGPHSTSSMPKQISYSIIIAFLSCVLDASPLILLCPI